MPKYPASSFTLVASVVICVGTTTSVYTADSFTLVGGGLRSVIGQKKSVANVIDGKTLTKVAIGKFAQKPEEFVPRTALGKKLWEARKRIVESGEPLRPAKELLDELSRSRYGTT
jgi:hypothetical protein